MTRKLIIFSFILFTCFGFGGLLRKGYDFLFLENKKAASVESTLRHNVDQAHKSDLGGKLKSVAVGNSEQDANREMREKSDVHSLERGLSAGTFGLNADWKVELSLSKKPYARTIRGARLAKIAAGSNALATSKEFLNKYAQQAFHSNPDTFVPMENALESSTALDRVLFRQEVAGVEIYNSRLSFVYNKNGDLVLVQANILPDEVSVSTSPNLSTEAAAAAAYESMQQLFARSPVEIPEAIDQLSFYLDKGKYIIHLSQIGNAKGIHKFNLVVPGVLAGEYEIFVDDASGLVVRNQKVSRL